MFQFISQDLQIDFSIDRWCCPIDAAVDAVKVANLVGVQVDSYRQPLASPADHGIDVSVGLPASAVQREEVECSFAQVGTRW